MKTYEEALAFIHGRTKFKKIPTLNRMKQFLELLGNPHQKIKAIHIAGTNGKGSTLAYLRNILQANGYAVGTYTSPFLIRFNERISVNGTPISDAEFCGWLTSWNRWLISWIIHCLKGDRPSLKSLRP
ncbi:hypothetical protein [Lentilactobacillus kosonis]|uniref:hypothetical protein n=1 Tax=Lentilactobacillus kosonis TaxID=2810561 RepID=UPI001CDC50FD|nr:hypothetical protein [Lentilactobacillus kosonis]